MTAIGTDAFNSCSALESIALPSGLTVIEERVFCNCAKLNDVVLPLGIKRIRGNAFNNCDSLPNPVLPSGIESIAAYAYSGCDGFTELRLPEGISGVEARAFDLCDHVATLTIPAYLAERDYDYNRGTTAGPTVIGYLFGWSDPYYGVLSPNGRNVTAVTITGAPERLGKMLFCFEKQLTQVGIPSSVTEIGEKAFWDCDGLTGIVLPSNLTTLGPSAFYDCDGFQSIDLPSGVTAIGASAFSSCTALERFALPAELTTIGDYAFSSCAQLGDISMADQSPVSKGGKIQSKATSNAFSIGSYSFSGCVNLSKVSILPYVTGVGSYAFSNCTKLTEVNIPNNIQTINEYMFNGCSNIQTVTIPYTLVNMNYSAGNYSSALSYLFGTSSTGIRHVRINGTPAAIGARTFYNCTGLRDIVIPDGTVGIEDYAFSGCSNLRAIQVTGSITNFSANALANVNKQILALYGDLSGGAIAYANSVSIPYYLNAMPDVFGPYAGTINKVDVLLAKFPNNDTTYWNHEGISKDVYLLNPGEYKDYCTETACTHNHTEADCGTPVKDSDGNPVLDSDGNQKYKYTGSCGCNYFDGAIQCMGFAYRVGNIVHENSVRDWWTIYNYNSTSTEGNLIDTIIAGDYIRFGTDGNGHSAIVSSVSNTGVTLLECNFNKKCRVKWNNVTWSDLRARFVLFRSIGYIKRY